MATGWTQQTTSVSRGVGVPSKVVGALAVLTAIFVSALDLGVHGHFSDGQIEGSVVKYLERRSHIKPFLVDQKDQWGQDETGKVTVASDGRRVLITGKVWNDQIKQEISDAALQVAGVASVDNQVETLNEPELQELQQLLKAQGVTMNYQVVDRGSIYLTGDLPKPELKQHITDLVQRIRGVRSVFNDMGKEQILQRMLRVHNIYFDFNKWKIRDQSQPVLDDVANKIEDYLAESPEGTVRVEGHTDSIASNQYNQWLSEKRAEAVLEALVSRGVPREKLKALGKGEPQLLVRPDDTPETRAENRRIEFYFE